MCIDKGLFYYRKIYYPSVSKLTAPFTQGSRKCAAINRCYRNDCGGSLPSLCKGRWHAERAGGVVGTDL